jgi:hypothetical protein
MQYIKANFHWNFHDDKALNFSEFEKLTQVLHLRCCFTNNIMIQRIFFLNQSFFKLPIQSKNWDII